LQHRELLQEQAKAMNASMRVMTPEEKWHAGRQADAFFGLLDQYNKLLEEHNKLKADHERHAKNGRSRKADTASQPA
jgi:hypothetical protein